MLRGQCGCARHRADAVHQRGLLQAKEAAARFASALLHICKTSWTFVVLLNSDIVDAVACASNEPNKKSQ